MNIKKIVSTIFVITIVFTAIAFLALYLMNILFESSYVYLITVVFFAVSLVHQATVNNDYAKYFRKHSLIYKLILAVAFGLLIIAIIANPTYYFAFIYWGLVGFDCTLGILLVAIYDQNKQKLRNQINPY